MGMSLRDKVLDRVQSAVSARSPVIIAYDFVSAYEIAIDSGDNEGDDLACAVGTALEEYLLENSPDFAANIAVRAYISAIDIGGDTGTEICNQLRVIYTRACEKSGEFLASLHYHQNGIGADLAYLGRNGCTVRPKFGFGRS
ncbi:MAG: hypothetical protein WCP14_01015 [bacterium]